jgi:hypothetical protein
MRIEELEFGKTYEIDTNGTTGIFAKGELGNGFKEIVQTIGIPYGKNTEDIVVFGGEDNFDYKEVKTEIENL